MKLARTAVAASPAGADLDRIFALQRAASCQEPASAATTRRARLERLRQMILRNEARPPAAFPSKIRSLPRPVNQS